MLVDEYQYQPIPLTMPGGKPCLCKPPWYLLLPSLSSEALSLPRLFLRAVSLQISRSPVAMAVCVEARPIPLWRNSYREDKHDHALGASTLQYVRTRNATLVAKIQSVTRKRHPRESDCSCKSSGVNWCKLISSVSFNSASCRYDNLASSWSLWR